MGGSGGIAEVEIGERRLFSQLWLWLKPDKPWLILLVGIMTLNVVVAIIGPIYLKNAIDLLDRTSNLATIRERALTLTMVYAGSLLLIFIIQVIQGLVVTRINSQFIHRLRVNAFEKIVQNKVSFFDHSEAGRIVSRITNDTSELMDSGNRFANAFSQLIIFTGVLIVMIYFNPILTVAALAITPFLFIISLMMRKFQRRAAQRWRRSISSVNTRFGEVMGSIAITKSFGREEVNLSKFDQINEETYRASQIRGMVIFANGPIADFLRTLGLITLLYFASIQFGLGESIAIVYLFILLQNFLYDPISTIARSYSQFQSSFAALDRILNIMADKETSEFQGGAQKAEELKGAIKFSNVNFAYNDDYVLEDINFEIRPGETVALVGHTGAGKSTIVSLLMRFYDIKEGRIIIDEKSILEYELASLRKVIGYVAQDVLLFSGTIRDNLHIVKPTATDSEIWRALDIVQAREFIEVLPNGLDTEVNEGGNNLSQGQKQMISLARAILIDPRILILDEFTSSLDLYTEAKIQDAIDRVLKGRTSIIIAHRLTTILKCDKIIVLENGKLIEIGTHTDLIKRHGKYAEIFEKYFSFQLADLKPIIRA